MLKLKIFDSDKLIMFRFQFQEENSIKSLIFCIFAVTREGAGRFAATLLTSQSSVRKTRQILQYRIFKIYMDFIYTYSN